VRLHLDAQRGVEHPVDGGDHRRFHQVLAELAGGAEALGAGGGRQEKKQKKLGQLSGHGVTSTDIGACRPGG
jgi:hypothetical protein